MKTPSENPGLPTNEHIASQTGLFGGEVLIYGLSQAEADSLIQFANDQGVAGAGHNAISMASPPLSEDQKARLRANGKDVAADAVEVYLGHTVDCQKPLFEALGIQA